MRLAKVLGCVVLAGLLGVAGWFAYHAGWPPLRSQGAAPAAAELPVVEYREVSSRAGGEAGILLTIDRAGQVTMQTLPLGAASKTMHARLTCDELAWLPEQMEYELSLLRGSYGSERNEGQGEVSVVYRWQGPEKRVIWRNPQSGPKPPEGVWAGLVAPLEDIRRRAEEVPAKATEDTVEDIIVYARSSSGIVGTYRYSLSIDKSGHSVLRGGLGWAAYARRGETQLTKEELGTLLRAFEQAKFADFQPCYGKHTPTNRQNAYLVYRGDRMQKSVTWMNAGSDPKPPEGWLRIVEILDLVWARAEQQGPRQPAPSPRR